MPRLEGKHGVGRQQRRTGKQAARPKPSAIGVGAAAGLGGGGGVGISAAAIVGRTDPTTAIPLGIVGLAAVTIGAATLLIVQLLAYWRCKAFRESLDAALAATKEEIEATITPDGSYTIVRKCDSRPAPQSGPS